MKRIFFAIFLAVCACSGGGTNTTNAAMDASIEDWQAREALCPAIETQCPDGFNVQAIIDQLPAIETERDNSGDYWQTSCETLERGIGDCKEQAALALRAINDSCLADQMDAWIAFIPLDETGGHAITIACELDKCFTVDLMKVSPTVDFDPIVQFNQSSIF